MSVRLVCLPLLCGLFGASAALGEEIDEPRPVAPRAVLLSLQACCASEYWGEAEAVLAEALGELGLELVKLRGLAIDLAERRAELVDEVEARDAAFGLYIRRSVGPDGVTGELWVHDRASGYDTQRSLDLAEASDAAAATEASRLLKEILRDWRGQPTQHAPPAPEVASDSASDTVASPDTAAASDTAPAPAAAPAAEPEPQPKAFGVRLGLSGQGSPGGAGGRAALELCFGYSVIPALALEVEALVTIAGGSVSTSEVYATMDVVAIRGWVIWEARDEGILRPSLGLGGGALLTRVKALASSDGSGGGDFLATGYLGALARLALALSRSLWLRVGLRVGLSLPEVEIHLGGHKAARSGMPLVEGFGAVELRF